MSYFFGTNAETSFVYKSVHDAAWSSVAAPMGPISVATRRSPDKELTAAESYAYSVSVRRAVTVQSACSLDHSAASTRWWKRILSRTPYSSAVATM